MRRVMACRYVWVGRQKLAPYIDNRIGQEFAIAIQNYWYVRFLLCC